MAISPKGINWSSRQRKREKEAAAAAKETKKKQERELVWMKMHDQNTFFAMLIEGQTNINFL
jgi:hypothetical protein